MLKPADLMMDRPAQRRVDYLDGGRALEEADL
jgi:hypothetical protein